MMGRSVKLTYALMVGAFLLACVSGYLLFTQARSLTMTRDQLEETTSELHEARSERERIRRQADDIRSEINLARAGTIYLVDSMEASQEFLAAQSIQVRLLCNQTSGGDQTSRGKQTEIAGNTGSQGNGLEIGSRKDEPDFIAFCQAFSGGADWRRAANAVAILRATAISPDDYGAVAAKYQGLLAGASGRSLESARMHEGLAYSRLRQGKTVEAVSAIRAAQRLEPDLALPAMTALKIECKRQAEAGQVRASLQALRARLEAKLVRIRGYLRHGPNPRQQRALDYAKVERRMIEQDPELYELCAYAGLERQT
jgi:hypothetical protein